MHCNYRLIDRSCLNIKPLSKRVHDLDVSVVSGLSEPDGEPDERYARIAGGICAARKSGSPVVMMLGGHVVRSGVQRYIIDLMERGFITCLSVNGSVMIHDFEFALIGATTESVAKYVSAGQFGLWHETGRINDIVRDGAAKGLGMGEAVGGAILDGDFPHKDISLLAACSRLGIPALVHVGIGCDIIHELPNCDGAATGETSYRDFLRLGGILEGLEGGVVMNFGSAVTAPEVFLKALSMARNLARQSGVSISRFTTAVFDLHDLPDSFDREPPKDTTGYYFRPWKTMLVRTVADGGTSFYVKGRHADTIPALWKAVNLAETANGEQA